MQSQGGGRRACVFCGAVSQKMSKEHLWPRWVRKLLPDEERDQVVTYTVADSHRGLIRTFDRKPFELTVKDVCERCNTGWMGELEEAMKSVARHLLLGGKRELHAGGQATMAAWAVLKTLVMARVLPRETRLVLDEDYRAVYECRDRFEPPAFMRVYTAKAAWSDRQARSGFFLINGVVNPESTSEDEADGYLATISVLDLVVQVFRPYGRDLPAEDFDGHSPRLAPSLRRIWPRTSPFVWPPGPALTTTGIKMLAGGEFA